MVLENCDLYWLTGLVTFSFHVVCTQFVLLSVTDTVYYYFCYDCFSHYIKSIVKWQVKQVNFLSIVYETFCPDLDFLSHSPVIVLHLFFLLFLLCEYLENKGNTWPHCLKETLNLFIFSEFHIFPKVLNQYFGGSLLLKDNNFSKVWFSISTPTLTILNLTPVLKYVYFSSDKVNLLLKKGTLIFYPSVTYHILGALWKGIDST